jgi:hypothetical protein
MALCFASPVEKTYYNQLKLVEKLDDKLEPKSIYR